MKIKFADYLINYIADLGVDKAIVYIANGDIVDAFTRQIKFNMLRLCMSKQEDLLPKVMQS